MTDLITLLETVMEKEKARGERINTKRTEQFKCSTESISLIDNINGLTNYKLPERI
jgi:hypothetical protein